MKPQGFALNMTPLIDIVFLLIIFFLVSSNLIQQDVSVEIDLPAAETARPINESQTRKFTVNIPKPGQILIGALPIKEEQLRNLLMDYQKANREKSELRIRTNKNVPYGSIEPLLVLAAQCNIPDVSFAVVEKK